MPNVLTKSGNVVRLECRASGNPAPNITWTRRNNLMPAGTTFESHFFDYQIVHPLTFYTLADYRPTADGLIIESVDRHKAGQYVCNAENGVGAGAIAVATVQVQCE